MFLNKSTIVFSVLALCNVVVAAQPPACLLSVIGSQPNPADLKTICGKNAEKIQDSLSETCDDDKQDALKHFSNTCSSNGHKVDVSTTTGSTSTATTTDSSTTTAQNSESTSTSSSGSGSGSSSNSSSGNSSNSDSTSGSSSSSSSASSSPSASDAVSAGASDRHVSAAAFAAVVFVGFAATL